MSAPQVAAAPASPWNATHRLTLVVLLAVGVGGLIAGYTGTSGTLRVSHQVAWIDLSGAALGQARLQRVELDGCRLDGLRSIADLRGATMPWSDIVGQAGTFAAALGIGVIAAGEPG